MHTDVKKRPNVLIVFGDQHRAGMTGAEGDRQAITPHIDRLAAQGVLLTHCIVNAPVCCPSRGTMWTGTYPTTHRVIANDLPIRTDLPSLATVARDAGYRTGYIGKWHLDGVSRRKFTPPGPRRLGFDDWAAYNCSHAYFNCKYYRDTDELIRVDGYEPTVQTDLAIEFIEKTDQDDRPFLLALSWGPPHDPYPQVPQRFRDMFDPESIVLRPNVKLDADNPLAHQLDPRRTTADYYAAITALDEELGRLLKRLNELKLDDNTLVIFTSDHGDMLWSHGWMKKQAPFDESIRVPFIARGPGVDAAAQSHGLFSLVDLTPTLLTMMGLTVPQTMQGHDRSGLLTGDQHASADAVLITNQLTCDESAKQNMPEWRGVRTAHHTYVEQVGGIPWLLYDNQSDPYQVNNRVNDPLLHDLQTRLKERLYALLQESNDPFLSGNQLLEKMGMTEAWAYRSGHMYD